jgi:hypothetical protein
MQDADLFLSIAEIAGVFVGFGALIALRTGATEPYEVAPVRMVVSTGVLTMVAGLAPVTLGRYGLADHHVWLLCSALVLVGYFALGTIAARTPEYRTVFATVRRTSVRVAALEGGATLLVVGAMAVALIAVVLGVSPELDSTLYFTAAVLILLQAAWTLLEVVFAHMRPAALPR